MYNLKIFSIRLKTTLCLLFMGLLLGSCEREMTTEIISVTPPELHVIVHQGADKKVRVSGATVKLYATTADRTAEKNVIASAVTNNQGEAIFLEKDFRKGILHVAASKDGTTAVASTPYLLQNDGKTIFWVSK